MKKHISIKKSESTNETTPFHIYKSEISDALISAGLFNNSFWEEMTPRISSMFNNGEPLYMAYSELELRFRKNKECIKEVSPLEIARKYGRIVTF